MVHAMDEVYNCVHGIECIEYGGYYYINWDICVVLETQSAEHIFCLENLMKAIFQQVFSLYEAIISYIRNP